MRPVAYPQNRHLLAEFGQIYRRRIGIANGEGATGKDNALRGGGDFGNVVVGMDFAINVQFADPAGDELGVLRTEIQNQNLLGGHASVSKVQK